MKKSLTVLIRAVLAVWDLVAELGRRDALEAISAGFTAHGTLEVGNTFGFVHREVVLRTATRASTWIRQTQVTAAPVVFRTDIGSW